jgi:glyoxylase-like metal-dependent hydrolase (beta-lactamase superfamily II)
MRVFDKKVKARVAIFVAIAAVVLISGTACAQIPQSLISENSLKKVSDHVFVLVGFPNVGIVVGSRGTLVVDTGLGERNGATVVRVAQKLANGPALYLTTTHYHSEHTSGEQAFPANTIIIRNATQQEEMEKKVAAHLDVFRKQSEINTELLKEVHFRPPDVVFDREMKLDLGGVTARMFWLGPAHTKGDELIFVEEDGVLLPGDIVQKTIFPIMPDSDATIKGWLANLDQLDAMHPRIIVTDHGDAILDASEINRERQYFLALQARVVELKRQGVSAEEAAKTITAELRPKYSDRPNPNAIAGEVLRVYQESQ